MLSFKGPATAFMEVCGKPIRRTVKVFLASSSCGSFAGIGSPFYQACFDDIEKTVDDQNEDCQNQDTGKYADGIKVTFSLGDQIAKTC